MRKIGILLFMIVVITTQAQEKHKLKVQSEGGYEYNYFKSPDGVLFEGEMISADELISSSTYQDVSAFYNYKYEWTSSRLRINANPALRAFYENTDDSYWSLNLATKYDTELGKKTKFLSSFSFKRMAREGLGGTQDVLINPLGYTQYEIASGIQFSPLFRNKTSVEGVYRFKNFDEFGDQDLEYDQYGVRVVSEQSIKRNKLWHKLGVELSFNKRLYKTFDATDAEPTGKRDWNYLKLFGFYRHALSKVLKLEPGFKVLWRDDVLEDRSGYLEFGPSLGLVFNNKTTKLDTSVKYLMRNYSTIEARNSVEAIGEKIEYTYLDFILKGSHKFNNTPFSLVAEIYSRVRDTNYTDIEARSFRGYRNQYAGLGVKWEL